MQLRLEVICNSGTPCDVEAKIDERALRVLGQKVGESNYVEKIGEETFKIRNIFAPDKRVPDVWRYVLRNTGSYISLREHSGAIEVVCKGNNKYRDGYAEEVDNCGITIALLLESPHKDEFDNNDSPIAPAQGTTGTNIHDYFEHIINIERRKFDFVATEARLIICNPIPFQTSLYMIHKGKINKKKKLKEDIWNALWEEPCIKHDFKLRMEKYKPSMIINACTGGKKRESLNAKVTYYLESIGICDDIYRTDHPSCWNIPMLQSA